VTDPVIETRELTRWYGPVMALGRVTLEAGPGITALLGENGAGKSTLLKILTGELRPSLGRALVLGEEPWGNPGLFRRVGYCPEGDALFEDMDAPSAVAFLLRLRGFDPDAARRRAEAALAAVGLDPAAWGRRTAGYSKGMRQRVRLAQALAHGPELVLLDEPLTGLDPVGRRDLRLLFRRLAAAGTSLVLSSHVLHEVEATTDRVLLLHRARLLAHGSVHEIRALIDRHPHSVEVACDRPRELAARLAAMDEVVSVRVEPGRVVAETPAPDRFYPALVRALADGGYRVERLSSPDDDLEAVFRYLVKG
jgi:ABC-2 type transport system ATP-binding protein